RRRPVTSLQESRRLIGATSLQTAIFAPRRPRKQRSTQVRREPCGAPEFCLHFLPQGTDLLADVAVHLPEVLLHCPEGCTVSRPQFYRFARKAFANARIGELFVARPALQHGPAHAVEARSILFIVALESQIEKPLRLFARYRGMLKIEPVLPVDVGEVHVLQHPSLIGHLLVERRARPGRETDEMG